MLKGDAIALGVTSDVFMLLAGYAIEALTKAIVVADGTAVVKVHPKTRIESLVGWFTTHRFSELLERCKVNPEKGDEDWRFVNRLERAVVWDGRYPAPHIPDEMDWTRARVDGDLAKFEELFGRLESIALERHARFVTRGVKARSR